ncbi:MAG TPA: hypothetical protein VLZ30_06225, partial [Verrucomicrobiae bacterium]|nr:hypothetical protein [Verrucomicrobiae bacterium]
MSDSNPLFGPDNKPLRPQDKNPLSFDIQNAVKIEVNTAMDHAREDLKKDFEGLRKGSLVRYGVTVAIGAICAILGYLNLLDKAENWTHDFVRDNMDKPMLDKAANEIMDSRIRPYVSNELVIATKR